MGRELVMQLAAGGCSVATCDLNEAAVALTASRAQEAASAPAHVTAHVCDVADEASVDRFRAEVIDQHRADHIDLLFNNAGIVGGKSFVAGDRTSWERTFDVCWGGTYNCSRVFLALLKASINGYLVNTSSVSGFWAGGRGTVNTAYVAAKFAVRGFSEALIEDFRVNAPNVRVAVVIPGHVGTDIGENSWRINPSVVDEAPTFTRFRQQLSRYGVPAGLSDDELRRLLKLAAPTSAATAAMTILDGVRSGRWRILVGDDVRQYDELVRGNPEDVYASDGPALANLLWQRIAAGVVKALQEGQ